MNRNFKIISNNQLAVFLLFTWICLALVDGPVLAQSQKPLVGNLKNPDVVEGCGCYFLSPAESKKRNSRLFLFMSDLDESTAYMNIDGQDVKLKRAGTVPLSEKAKKGERFTRMYAANSIKVRVEFIISWVCPPKDESCEVIKYDAIFTVEKGGRKEVVQAKGDCGC